MWGKRRSRSVKWTTCKKRAPNAEEKMLVGDPKPICMECIFIFYNICWLLTCCAQQMTAAWSWERFRCPCMWRSDVEMWGACVRAWCAARSSKTKIPSESGTNNITKNKLWPQENKTPRQNPATLFNEQLVSRSGNVIMTLCSLRCYFSNNNSYLQYPATGSNSRDTEDCPSQRVRVRTTCTRTRYRIWSACKLLCIICLR